MGCHLPGNTVSHPPRSQMSGVRRNGGFDIRRPRAHCGVTMVSVTRFFWYTILSEEVSSNHKSIWQSKITNSLSAN